MNEKGAIAAALGALCCKTCGTPLQARMKTTSVDGRVVRTVATRFCPNCSKYKAPDHPSDCFCADCLR